MKYSHTTLIITATNNVIYAGYFDNHLFSISFTTLVTLANSFSFFNDKIH